MVDETDKRKGWFECVCHDPEHIFRLLYVEPDISDDWPPELYVSVHLTNYKGFFRRLWVAFKYVFWMKDSCISGHFEDISIQLSDLPRLRAILDHFESEHIASGWTYDGSGWCKKELDKPDKP